MRSRGTTRKRLRKKFPPSLEDQNLQGLPQAQTADRIFSTLSALQGTPHTVYRSGVRGRDDRPCVAKWIFSIISFKAPLLSLVSGD
jgi:hypothetical protein